MTRDDALARYPGAEVWAFGDGAELSALVRSGEKRATCGVEAACLADGDPLRRVEPAPFRDMPEDWALMDGEDATLGGWQAGHRACFERNGGYDPDMWLIWEAFEVIEDFAGEGA